MTPENKWIDVLGLEPHIEGGYFRRTYTSPTFTSNQHSRVTMSSIYYMLTASEPFGRLHRNESDIVHYFHDGGALEYFLFDPEAGMTIFRLGCRPDKGELPQLTVKGGVWKATRLLEGDYALISEAVTPGFEYGQLEIASDELVQEFLTRYEEFARFVG